LYSLRAAASAKQNGKAKRLFYDARELYTELPTVAGKPLKKWYWKRWERKGLKQTDLVIVTAPDDAEAIQNVYGFLPESILVRNLPKREELKSNNYLREYFSIPAEEKIFVYIGGSQKERGLSKMIDAVSVLQNEAAFVMIGDGPIKEELQKVVNQMHLQENVFFHPSINSERTIEILASADIGISLIEQHSKSYELGLPSKVFEYMLAGLPVISSPLKQVKDLFDRTEGILFADPADSSELFHASKKAIELSSDSKLRNRIHSEAYKNFTFETDAKPFKTFLTQHPTPDTRPPLQ
jgi:glycosyltransferase involved in cell wall biosynthesis